MMRNIPFPFLTEETLDSISRRAQGLRSKQNEQHIDLVRLSPRNTAGHWREITEHKWFLSERLGRDVGGEVAALDYVTNIMQLAEKHARSRRAGARGWFGAAFRAAGRAFEAYLESSGTQSFANAHLAMRYVPNLTRPASPNLPPKTVRLSAKSSARFSNEIEEHKWFLSERLGRDAGMQVAALDYLRNVRNAEESRFSARVLHFLDKMMNANGPNSIANLERAMHQRADVRRERQSTS